MSDSDQTDQWYEQPATEAEPAVGGWGDTYETYGDAPAQQGEQSTWDTVTEWVEDLWDDGSSQSPPEGSSGWDGVTDIVDDIHDHLQEMQRRHAEHRDSFRGRLNSAIQATEMLGRESTADEIQYASGLITTAANTAYQAAHDIGDETATGSKYAQYHATLAWAASELEGVAWSDSEAAREYSIPGILANLRDVGSQSESLY